jgi:hypothetical protein
MRLYTRTGATVLNDPEYGTFEANDQGAFELPDELAERLHRFHVGKQPLWEDEEQRHQRIVDEEMARAKDPATLLAVVQQLAMLAKAAIPAQPNAAPLPAPVDVPSPAPAPAKRAAKRAGTPTSD